MALRAGIRFEDAVPRCDDLWAYGQATRGVFGSCWFDVERRSEGITGLKQYSKEWDEKRGAWKNHPRHDGNSHIADGFRTFARGYTPPDYWVVEDMDDDPMPYEGQDECTGY